MNPRGEKTRGPGVSGPGLTQTTREKISKHRMDTRRLRGSAADRGAVTVAHGEAKSPYLLGTQTELITGELKRFLGFAFKLQIHVRKMY